MPAATHSYTVEALKGQAVMKSLQSTVDEIKESIGRRLFDKAARWNGEPGTEVPDAKELITGQDKILLKRRVFALKRSGYPAIVTHNMADDAADPILNQIRRVQLFNHPSDRVKIIFHPEVYLTSKSLANVSF